MEISDKTDAAQILAVWGTREHVDCGRVFWNMSFLPFK